MSEFEFKPAHNTPISDEELLSDLKKVAKELGADVLPQSLYAERGKFNFTTIAKRFGSWNNAARVAGLKPANVINYTDEELFENILNIWQYKGKQPARRDLELPPSKISQSPYNRRFRGWTDALKEFVAFANKADNTLSINDGVSIKDETIDKDRSRRRDPSLRLRFKVLRADNFKCRSCGKSLANDFGVELQIDHIIPWSNGGDTIFENLQTLCSTCNIGKSNI